MEMVVAVIDPLSASPVLLPHVLALSPFVMPHVLVSIVVTVPPIIAVVLGKDRTEGKSCTHHRERNRLTYAFHANHSFNRDTYWTSLFAAKSQQIAPRCDLRAALQLRM
jgi:hypothetical protein